MQRVSFVDPGRRDVAHGRAAATDLAIRAGGLALLAFAAAAIDWLATPAHADARHVATLLDYGAAAIAFLGASGGGMLLCLGAHIHDPVAISERWRPRL